MNNVTPSSRTALVVEGCELTRQVLHDVLVDAGVETTAVGCGQSALAMLAGQCFDVLIADVHLPDTNGLVVCDAARERYQDQIVILVMTGVNIEHRRIGSVHLCADDFLGKPFDPYDLIALIERTMGRAPEG